jgi:hypothetical protein
MKWSSTRLVLDQVRFIRLRLLAARTSMTCSGRREAIRRTASTGYWQLPRTPRYTAPPQVLHNEDRAAAECGNSEFGSYPSRPGLSWMQYDIQIVNGRKIMSFLIEFWDYMAERKKFWLLPIFAVIVILGGLLVLSQGSPVAPFIYTIF